jgi:HSP20 family protein
VHIELHDHTLEIRAERKQEEATTDKDKGVRRSEFRYGSFFRVLRMPENVKESDVHATYKDGILEVRAPLEATPKVEPKAIPVERKD